MNKKYICLFLGTIIILGILIAAILNKTRSKQIEPPLLITIDGRYFSFVKRNPDLTEKPLQLILQKKTSNDEDGLYRDIIRFGRMIKLNEKVALNAMMHGLMAFGPDHPVYIGEGKSISIIKFIQNYFDYIPPDISKYAPAWIDCINGEYFSVRSYTPRIIPDHLGQLFYVCALVEIPLETQFKLKSADYVSLANLIQTEMKYSGPNVHDPIWQTVALAYYWPDKTWKNINKEKYSSLDLLEKTSLSVEGHITCGHTHSLISAAYAISKLKTSNEVINKHGPLLEKCEQNLESWINVIKETIYPDGIVSQRWYSNEKTYPKSMNEIIMLNGHILEFLATYLDEKQLSSPWVTKIADRFCKAVVESIFTCSSNNDSDQLMPFEYASLCHGIRGLLAYCNKLQIDLNIERNNR